MLHSEYTFIGIDYGSKMAGTTAIAYLDENETLHIVQSEKKKDADRFIRSHIEQLNPRQIFIDAPLSLPGSYYGKSADFFYRTCDRLVGAMSPMFLGGLTARAMKLSSELKLYQWIEVYPAELVKELHIQTFYQKKDRESLEEFWVKWKNMIPFTNSLKPQNYHQMDALLAWTTGWRYVSGKALMHGQREEGLIWV